MERSSRGYAFVGLVATCDAAAVVAATTLAVSSLQASGAMLFASGVLLIAYVSFRLALSGPGALRHCAEQVSDLRARSPTVRSKFARFALMGSAAKIEWATFLAAIAIGSPVVAIVVVMGGWPMAHAALMLLGARSDGAPNRYNSPQPAFWASMAAAAMGMALCAWSASPHSSDVPPVQWWIGAALAVATLALSGLNTCGLRFAVMLEPSTQRKGPLSAADWAIVPAAAGSLMTGAALLIAGTALSAGPQWPKAALVAVFVTAGNIGYRSYMTGIARFDAMTLMYAAPAVSSLILVLAGIAQVRSIWTLAVGATLLFAGNLWAQLSERG